MNIRTTIRRSALVFLASATLTMGGCCDKCGKQLVQALKAVYLAFANNAAQCCNRLTPEIADECIGNRQTTFDESTQLALAAKAACDAGNQELMNQIINAILDRLLKSEDPASPMSRSIPIANSDGRIVNALPLFGCSERLTISSSAIADGQWIPKTTAIVNGREVLPEAAGNAALKDREDLGQHGAAITEILLASEPQALKFAEYTLADGGVVRYDNGAFIVDFTMSGTLSISTFKAGGDGRVVALPGDTTISMVGDDGAIHLVLDKTRAENRLEVGPDGSGVLYASFAVRGTEDFDFIPSMYEKVWFELPFMMDANDFSIDFSAAGQTPGCELAPYGDQDESVEPAPDGFPRACDLIDTDGDGVPDTTRIEHELKEDMEELLETICDD